MNGTAKARRQRAILELVRERAIGSQDELAEGLERRGHTVSQSTLSRDLKQLRISRMPIGEGYRYLPAGEEPAAPATSPVPGGIAAEVIGVYSNEVAVVVRTQVGRAQGVAVYLDGLRLDEVLATIAGDDTILVVPTSTRKTPALKWRLRELFELG